MSDEAAAAAPAQLNEAILEVAAALDIAREAVGRGDVIDLTRIEGRVVELCATAQAGPAGSAPILRPGFVTLIAALEALRLEIVRQHTALRGELQGLSERQRASTAYGGTPRKGR
ncbi:MAG: hypothetical protein AB7K86_01975 [Rhodospirillales bacterium]